MMQFHIRLLARLLIFFKKKQDVSDLNVFLSLANAVNRGPESVASLKVRIPTYIV